MTGIVFKNRILLLRKKIVFPTVNFCFYIILAVFHFDYFWVNLGGSLRFAENQGIQEKHFKLTFEVDLIPASYDTSFPVANLKGNVSGDTI